MTVERILNTKGHEVVRLSPARSLSEAAKTMAERRIGAVLVMETERVLGILSERDIVRAVALGGASALEDRIEAHMTTRVVTCTPRSAINDVMELMTVGKFRHVPVMEDGRLAGIVSIGDVVKQRLAEIEAESQALREYIATA
jgi:CBS domain-containing protein